jgi:DNA-binding response OmpR family regulator
MMSPALAYIIEDDKVIAQIFGVAVREAGYEVETITDGVTALARVLAAPPDLVVLDLHLPGISGIQILREIRDDPNLVNVRVMVVSADVTQTEFLRVNADLVAVKPVGFQQLKSMAEKLRRN